MPNSQKHQFGVIEVDSNRHMAFRDGNELHLSPTGFRILETLVMKAPGMVHKKTLENMLWGENAPDGSALRNHIHELRKVLDRPFDVPLLETVPHLGWRLRLPPV